ncbi:hypothetical protein CLAFUW4_13984 [Fulvia fulva]|uniref:Uncharacterized protein n=1 Tax=Passalora fulva TaxID=5499 RepID=A0A9Q8PLA5_PASFU|nr:uncharacterized protein CLAFUR5_13822 [Fulvia fulva]KAK4610414.1 hypothetical protein CLAFUR4_13987 [Fulvia fulva]KAK4611410.1 hypothetical protein CLAFUR0_13991 [Fulvia fulva]UJO24497.1 hypothetical protein CLAFUR5_13822 [Fulvia fulva]WPV21834.1 hypothetical protein CLAFUW4_13984 [Fulvia fulva]WPV37025.1 hypothetical protein CLAFUW7_13992 [Fulvia fulva]
MESTSTSDRCFILEIPTELRLIIYEMSLADHRIEPKCDNSPPLLVVCKAMRNEALEVFEKTLRANLATLDQQEQESKQHWHEEMEVAYTHVAKSTARKAHAQRMRDIRTLQRTNMQELGTVQKRLYGKIGEDVVRWNALESRRFVPGYPPLA